MVLKGSIGQMTCDLDKDVQDFWQRRFKM
jgi:hypothetical protein